MTRGEAIQVARVLQALIEIQEVSIVLNTFIRNFQSKSIQKADGIYYLHGNFNLNGPVSGRMSSSDPNMQNIPSNSKYGKLVKYCFEAMAGWLMTGADFSSLEDRISALTTRDPNKLKVYLDGYDGHCLRAFSYFKDAMPDIHNTLAGINSIETKYPTLRQKSKGPTFLLTYGGTHHGLVNTIGLPVDQAKKIEENYHELYEASDKWVEDKIAEASRVGHVTGAFGLRLRTPILQQVLLGRRSTPHEAKGEARTAGNMLGQSYGLLNNRAAAEFQRRCLNSEYKYMIMPIAHIHDAQYFIVKNHLGCIRWFNKNLVECMQWQDLPEIQHPDVHLGGDVALFHPNWAYPITLPNDASKRAILRITDGK